VAVAAVVAVAAAVVKVAAARGVGEVAPEVAGGVAVVPAARVAAAVVTRSAVTAEAIKKGEGARAARS
jgi:hypothetical protein